ncbi:MAG: hypothetical protein PHY47_18225 [Lachnospiraceae bacterium]|nr:hypothetical protein [Lachnospiraceae bacterium]
MVQEYNAYYFDLSFEETLKRHQTKTNCNDFGEKEMRRWWREKDFSDVLNEISIACDKDKISIVSEIYDFVLTNKSQFAQQKFELTEVKM